MEQQKKKIGRPVGSKTGEVKTVKARTVEINTGTMACPTCKVVGRMKIATTHSPIKGLKVSYLHCRFCQSRTRLERRVEDADLN